MQPDNQEVDDLLRARTTLGNFELTVLSDGTYYLDGGAMFGVEIGRAHV